MKNILRVIEYIKNNQNWREILSESPYNITIKDDGDFTLLKYSQIDSDFNNEIVRECRGLIIDKNFNPVCVPFYKFGNYGESYADNIDWTTAKVEEKIVSVQYETRKEYAEMATKTKYPAFFFVYYDGKVKTPQEWIWSLTNDKIIEQLERLQ